MAVQLKRGRTDRILRQIMAVLGDYAKDHPGATVDLYRENKVSVRIRVVDPSFKGVPRFSRHDALWAYLDRLSEDAAAEIVQLIPITADEKDRSASNFDFEDALRSDA